MAYPGGGGRVLRVHEHPPLEILLAIAVVKCHLRCLSVWIYNLQKMLGREFVLAASPEVLADGK